MKKKYSLICWLVIFPFFASTVAYLLFPNQNPWTWYRLMPTASLKFAQSPLHLILLYDKVFEPDLPKLQPIVNSPFLHPHGSLHSFYAADFNQAQLPNEQKLLENIAQKVVLYESVDVLQKFLQRFPELKKAKSIGSFEEAVSPPNPPFFFNTQLSWLFILRLGAVIGMIMGVILIMACLFKNEVSHIRLFFSLLGFPIALIGMVIFYFLLTSLSHKIFPGLGYLLYLATSLLTWKLFPASHSIMEILGVKQIFKGALLSKRQWGVFVIIGVAFSLLSFRTFLTHHLTTYDGARQVVGASYIYHYKYWAIDKVSERENASSHTANYPPFGNFILSIFCWVVGPQPSELFIPGIQTGTILLCYTATLWFLHLFSIFIITSALLIAFGKFANFGFIALSIVCTIHFIPSMRGGPGLHCSEQWLWPMTLNMLALGFVGNVLSEKATTQFWKVFFLVALSLCLIKREASAIFLFLALPWFIETLCTMSISLKSKVLLVLKLVPFILLFTSPLILLKFQHIQNGLINYEYPNGYELSLLVKRSSAAWEAIVLSFQVFLGLKCKYPRPCAFWQIPLLMTSLITLLYSQILSPSFKRMVIPLGISFFLFFLPLLYVISIHYQDPYMTWEHCLSNTWNRISVPALVALGFLLLKNIRHLMLMTQHSSSEQSMGLVTPNP